ncbi:hypothetical protein [Microbulbifer sp. PSTR4-B]|uniref:hypothetical protein n=1 Tax=unclassified Microbulbifer TaxID=2619833 RepID=UPI00403A81D9
MKPRIVELELPRATLLQNQWERLHFRQRTKYKKDMAMDVAMLLRQQGINLEKWQPMKACTVEILRGSSALPDWDGLFCVKAPLDVLPTYHEKVRPHGLGVIQDDNMKCIRELTVRAVKIPRKSQPFTQVRIVEVLA